MNSDLVEMSANAPLVQPLLPLSQSLSDISVQILLDLEKGKHFLF
jgi:hexosaminidase